MPGVVFRVDNGRTGRRIRVSFIRLQIRDGRAGDSGGGGIRNAGGAVLVQETLVTHNISTDGAGGIDNGTGSILSIVHSSVDDNGSAPDDVGGLPGRVGGIDNSVGAILYVDNSTVSANWGNRFGGIRNLGYLAARNTTISGNNGRIETGGLTNTGTAYLNNVTITGNQNAEVDSDGGQINKSSAGGVDNSGGYLALANTIIAGNTNALPSGPQECVGTLSSAGYNVIGQNYFGIGRRTPCSIAGTTTGNQIDVDAAEVHLGPLQDNGGSTRTHALLAGSLARNQGNPAVPNGLAGACESTDQRSAQRGIGASGRCDVGAYELGGGPGNKATP